jgi:hypothetical protein
MAKARITQEEFDALAEALQAEYNQLDDGRYQLQVESVDNLVLDDTTKLKQTLGQLRKEVAERDTRLKAFGEVDPKDIETWRTKAEELENMDLDAKVQESIKAREAQLVKKHQTDLEKVAGERDAIRGNLEQIMIRDAATQALAGAKGNVRMLLPHVISRTRLREDSGKFFVEVVDENGVVQYSPKSGSTDPMSIGELVETMKSDNDFSAGFEGTNHTGSGGSNDNNSRGRGIGNLRTVSHRDQDGLRSTKLEDIATGKVQVDMND